MHFIPLAKKNGSALLTSFCQVGLIFMMLNFCLVGSCKVQAYPSAEKNTGPIKMAMASGYIDLKNADAPLRHFIMKKPDLLINLSAQDAKLILGEPVFKQREGTAETWLYQNASCVMSLYVYNQEERALVVDYDLSRVVDPFGTSPDLNEENCLNEIFGNPKKQDVS
jgi:hypothetical protein